jgi:hypothetical protein
MGPTSLTGIRWRSRGLVGGTNDRLALGRVREQQRAVSSSVSARSMQRDSMAICPDSQMLIGQSVCCAFVVRGSWETVGRTWAQRWASSSILGLATDGLWSGRAHGRKPSVVDVFVPFCQHTLGPARRPARASITRYCCSSNTQLQRRRQDARITNLLSYITPFECFQF